MWPFKSLQSDQVWCAYLQGFSDLTKKGWSHFQVTGHFKVQSWHWDLYVYYPIHRWTWLLLDPLAYGTGDRLKTEWSFILAGYKPPFWVWTVLCFQSPPWIPELLKKHFCPRIMLNLLLLLRGGFMQKRSYSAILLTPLLNKLIVLVVWKWSFISWMSMKQDSLGFSRDRVLFSVLKT